jgi:hypothetical protein
MNLIEQDSILVTDEFEETDEEDSVEETIESDSDSIVTNESDDADGESINGEDDSEVEDPDNVTLLLISNHFLKEKTVFFKLNCI